MGTTSLPSYGFLAFDFVSEVELINSKNSFVLEASSYGHIPGRELRWVCSALPVGTASRVTRRHHSKERDKWISQLKNYLKQGKIDEAEQLMAKLQDSGVRLNLLMYNSMMTVYGKADRFLAAQSWFRRLEEDKSLEPDAVTYRSMIGACGRAGELKQALIYYHKMRVLGFLPSIHNFNTLINLHRRDGTDIDCWEKTIHRLLSDMRELGCIPDSSTFDVTVKLYEKFQKIEDLPISLLEAAGWSPSCKCHGILLKSYIRCGLVDKALDEFYLLSSKINMGQQDEHNDCINHLSVHTLKTDRELPVVAEEYSSMNSNKVLNVHGINYISTKEGSRHPPNVMSRTSTDSKTDENHAMSERLDEALCHSLICLCKTLGRYTEAMDVYREMRKSGTHPSWLTACTIIDVCSRMNESNAVETGRALFDEMRISTAGRESTDAGAYTVTINMYLKAYLTEKAAEISDMVTDHVGLVPDPPLFLAMMKSYSRNGMHTKATQVYKRMLDCKLTWTACMFNGVIHSCGKALPLEEITKVFLAMVHGKMPLSSVTCNLIMHIFSKAGLLEKAENVFRLAKEQKVLNAVSYNTIINAYGKFKEFNKMERALMDMQDSGFKDNVEAYNSMIDAYGKAGRTRRMENIIERMRKVNCSPDLSTFNILINVYGREGLIRELQEVRKNMEEAGIKPNNYTFNTLIHAYGNAEMPDEAMDAFKEMQDVGLVPDHITYNSLVRAFQKSGNELEAARWSLWMEQLGLK